MKKLLLGIYLISAAIFANAQGLENIIVEKYYIADQDDHDASVADGDVQALPVGAITYRIYVDMLPGYRAQFAYWNETHNLNLKTSTFFYNNANGQSIPAFTRNGLKTGVQNLDSWVTFGSVATSNNWGILKSDDSGTPLVFNLLKNTDAAMGIPLTTQDGIYQGNPTPLAAQFAVAQELQDLLGDGSSNGNLFTKGGDGNPLIAGSWYNAGSFIGANPATFPTGNENRVLIAQLTTDGVLEFKLNIQVVSNTSNISEYYVWNRPGLTSTTVPEYKFAACSYPMIDLPPTVTFISSNFNDKQAVSIPTQIVVDAVDPDDNQIDSVIFHINNKRYGKVTSSPYQVSWTTPAASSFKGQDTMSIVTVLAYDKDTLRTVKIDTIITDRTITNSKSIVTSGITCKVFPNPVKDILTIETKLDNNISEGTITIYNIYGAIVAKRNTGKVSGLLTETFDMSGYPTGQYIVEIKKGSVKSVKRVIKN